MSAAPACLARLRAQTRRGPAQRRIPVHVGALPIGSIAPEILNENGGLRRLGGREQLSNKELGDPPWVVQEREATPALAAIACALRAAGCCGPWRDEQLAVRGADGTRIATVERGAVRVLGIATEAVHLVGVAADGQGLWLQQRALTKAYYPGAWDTLMGGMVAAEDTLEQALARETREEAGLEMGQLAGLRPGAAVQLDQPSDEGGPQLGHMRERVSWWAATLPPGVVPVNQDGEAAGFACWSHAQVREQLARGAFMPEAALVLGAYYGW